MYINNFKNGILNAYSKDPHIVDRKVDQNHLETVKHQFNVEKFEKEYELKLRKENREAEAARKKAEDEGKSSSPLLGPMRELSELEGYGKIESSISLINKAGYDAVNEFKGAFGNVFSAAEMVEIANKMPESFSDIGGVWEVEVGGRKRSFDLSDPNNVVALEKFKSYVAGTDPATQEVRGAFKGAAENMLDIMTRPGSGAMNLRKEDLPNFGIKVVGDSATGFKVQRIEGGDEEYRRLLQKKATYRRAVEINNPRAFESALTEAEEKTLEALAKMHYISDGKLSPGEKKEAFMGFKSEMYDIVGLNGVKALPQTYKEAAKAYQGSKLFDVEVEGAVYTYNPQTSSLYLSENSPKSGDPRSANTKASVIDKFNKGEYVREIDVSGVRGGARDMSSIFSEGFSTTYKGASEIASQAAEKGTLNMSQRSGIYTSEMPGYGDIAALIGMPSNSKEPITVYREVGSDGKPTGNYKAFYNYQKKKDGKIDVAASDLYTIDAAQAQQIKSLDFATQNQTPYDVSFNKPATKSLGSSKLTEERKMFENFAVRGVPPALDMTNRLVQRNTAESYGGGQAREIVNNLYNKYDSGVYTFKLEPASGVYTVAMYEGNKRVHFVPYRDANGTPKKVLAIDEVAILEHNDATMWKSEVFTDYIENNVMNALMNRGLSEFIQN
jgi:hypothetical protein